MPTNKNASFRYRVLNQCFANRGRQKWTIIELIEEVSRCLQVEFGTDTTISKRTLQDDISVMRSTQPRGFNAPIICKDGKYFYDDHNFSIEKPPLKGDDLNLLRETMAIFKQIPGMPQLPLLDALLSRLERGKPVPGPALPFIQFETNLLSGGTQWIATLYQAITNQQVLEILFQPFMEPVIACVFHPYLLKEWRNRWYVFGKGGFQNPEAKPEKVNSQTNLENIGFILQEDQIWHLALDRIATCKLDNEIKYLPNRFFDPAIWFENIVGITKPEGIEPIDIEIETDIIVSYYLESKPIHSSQRLLMRNEEIAVLGLSLIPNIEIIFDLLAYGKHIRVLGPASFKEMISATRGS